MNIHEYQAKEILKSYGIPVPAGRMVKTIRQTQKVLEEFGRPCILKAQIYAGGRGKAGGVKKVQDPFQAVEAAKELFKKKLVTIQTGSKGLAVKRILVEETVDIEEVAHVSPKKIHTLYIDPFLGVRSYHARRIAMALELKGKIVEDGVKLMQNLYKIVLEKDCSLIEINPLAISKAGELIAMDCKINFDDNALFRHSDYEKMIDFSQLDALEIQAKKFDLAYIKLNGNIGCMVNGAGLAMATLDVLKEYGGEPANFLDVGGGANREKVAAAFRIILKDKNVKGIFVNIFGGIMRCDIIAQGIIDATTDIACNLPIGDGVAKIVQRVNKKRKVIAN